MPVIVVVEMEEDLILLGLDSDVGGGGSDGSRKSSAAGCTVWVVVVICEM